jgi:peptidoglycan/LPS O-acetylase OafA/YrhL
MALFLGCLAAMTAVAALAFALIARPARTAGRRM